MFFILYHTPRYKQEENSDVGKEKTPGDVMSHQTRAHVDHHQRDITDPESSERFIKPGSRSGSAKHNNNSGFRAGKHVASQDCDDVFDEHDNTVAKYGFLSGVERVFVKFCSRKAPNLKHTELDNVFLVLFSAVTAIVYIVLFGIPCVYEDKCGWFSSETDDSNCIMILASEN